MRETQNDAVVDGLVREREMSATPHLVNEKIIEREMAAQVDRVQAYPSYIAINHTTSCNARCRFCFYYAKAAALPRMTVQDFEDMPWLRFVSTIDLFCGLGEPLMNPDFCDIVDLLRERNPLQRLQFVTNGQLLCGETAQRLAGRVDSINISINAATRETYEYLMPRCQWDKLIANLEEFQRINKACAHPTKLTFSCVLTQHNIKEISLLPTLVRRLGGSCVGLVHFASNGIWPPRRTENVERDCKRLVKTDTLFFHKTLYDEHFFAIWEAFKSQNIGLTLPPRFNEDTRISFGTRVQAKSFKNQNCSMSWTQCYICPPEPSAYLSGTDNGKRWCVPCCSLGADISLLVPFSRDNFLEDVWNSSAFRCIRRHANHRDDMLSCCVACRSLDKADPKNSGEIFRLLKVAGKEIYDRLGLPWPHEMEKRAQAIDEVDRSLEKHFPEL